jgi:DNA-binding NarL/FixJ family response regulator
MFQGFDAANQADRLSLLIADDDPVVRSMLSMSLEQRFEIVAAVGDAVQAADSAAALRPDAAIVDVDMPGGGGQHAVRGIAERSPNTAVVVLSADEEDSAVRDLLQAGAVTCCRKGIASPELSELIERSVDAVRQQGAASARRPQRYLTAQ